MAMDDVNEEEFEGGSGNAVWTEKILTRLPISTSFKVKRDTLISMEESPEDFIRNEVRVRIEQFVVAEKLAADRYHTMVGWKQPATTWDMYKHTHADSWWLGWLVRRRPARCKQYSQLATIEVERYAAYPDATVEFPHLGKPVPIELIKEK
jgi:hypothetical protein